MEKALEVCAVLFNQALAYRRTSEYYETNGDKEAAKRYAAKAAAVSESEATARKMFGYTFQEVVEAAVVLDGNT